MAGERDPTLQRPFRTHAHVHSGRRAIEELEERTRITLQPRVEVWPR